MRTNPVTEQEWKAAQVGEADYWGDQYIGNENIKQELHFQKTYALYMGLGKVQFDNFLEDKDIIDIGGGPVSMLLKRKKNSTGKSVVIDPLPLNLPTIERYLENKIFYWPAQAETVLPLLGNQAYDEAWIYNCLAHVVDPVKVLKEAKRICKRLRIFEVLHTGTDYMHPWTFTREFFDNILGEGGSTMILSEEGGVRGEAFFGQFNFTN